MGRLYNRIQKVTTHPKMKLCAILLGSALAGKPCDNWTIEAVASFDIGHTENVPTAMYQGATKVEGTIHLESNSCNQVRYSGTLTGLADGTHGWHVHNGGNTDSSCGKSATGGHFNPFDAKLGDKEETRSRPNRKHRLLRRRVRCRQQRSYDPFGRSTKYPRAIFGHPRNEDGGVSGG